MRFLLLVASILLIAACQSPTPPANGHTEAQIAQQEQKRQEIMDVHDAVMPEMGVINRLSRQLKPLVKENLAEDEQEILLDALKNLSLADEGMMGWMAEFHGNLDMVRDTMDHQAVMSYLETELGKIQTVDTQMRSSIEAAQKLVEQYGLNKKEGQ